MPFLAHPCSQTYGLICCGGTFGCVGQPLAPLSAEQFLPHLQPILTQLQDATWQVQSLPTLKDSSQVEPHDWFDLLRLIVSMYQAGIRQIIVIHGTDTLAYTACFLAEALVGSDLNVVVTGSQLPLLHATTHRLDPSSDAIDNLKTACAALHQQRAGVRVAFNGESWHAQTVQKVHSRDLSAFAGHSRAGYPAASYQQLSDQQRQHWLNDAEQRLIDLATRLGQSRISVYYAVPQPLDHSARQLEQLLSDPHDGLILLGYGLGNFPDHPQIRALLKRAHQQGTLVVLSTQVPYGGTEARYASGDWLSSVGVLPSARLTLSAIYARLVWLCATRDTPAERRRRWSTCLNDSRTTARDGLID
jgi:L-asparaginase